MVFLRILKWVLGFFRCLHSSRLKECRSCDVFLPIWGIENQMVTGSSLFLELLAVLWFLLRALEEKQQQKALL